MAGADQHVGGAAFYGDDVEINIDLRFPRDAASVPAIRRLLDASLDVLGVEEPIRGDIRLMLTEACANVVQHARAGDAYTVRVLIMDERCVIKVIDHGRGFDPARLTVTRPVAADPTAEHGRGMLIMESLADQVRLHSYPEHGALVSLEKKLHYGGDTLGRRLADSAWLNGDGPPPGSRVRLMNEADPELQEFATKLFDLAREGQTEQLVAYVEAGVPANLSNDRGDTLLMLAAYHGHADTVSALAARGADPDRENDRGQRPLAGAVFKKEAPVVRALLEAGADPRAGTPSAYDTAQMFGHSEFVAWFDERATPSA
jgi:anti-sigma regulatory factor (Ser/Thr protein kinase)